MDLKKSPFFEKDTYTQDVRCWYCGLLNTVKERVINCALDSDDLTLLWYTWCQACCKRLMLKDTIYTLVRLRLVNRAGCFQAPHKCGNIKLFIGLHSFQKKCQKHKDCWEYYCKKCLMVCHVSKMPHEVRTCIEKVREEKVREEKPSMGAWDDVLSIESDSLLD